MAGWLGQIGLPEYAPMFAEHAIDREVLADLNDQDLKELGVPLGHRKKLLKAIAALSAADETASRRQARSAGPERRQLTVLFCDLVGSTELSTAARSGGLNASSSGPIRARCADEVARFEGHVAKYMGDGVLAYFG